MRRHLRYSTPPPAATGRPGSTGGSERAILYCRAHDRSYSSPYAFRDARTNDWINPQSFQILSPGLRGGVLAGGNPGFPDGLQEAHLDMMSNFTPGTMEDALP